MSAAEIIEQIKALPPEEKRKVVEALREIDAAPAAGGPVSDEFKKLADEVFTTNAELFRKLAQ